MKKLLEKDKQKRIKIKKNEKKNFILKSIFKNDNFFNLIRWQSFLKLKKLTLKNSKISLSNKCLYTMSKKKFNKTTLFSRHVLLKQIRSGDLSNIQKATW